MKLPKFSIKKVRARVVLNPLFFSRNAIMVWRSGQGEIWT